MSYEKGMLEDFDTFIFDWDGTITTGTFLRKLNERINPIWNYRKKRGKESVDNFAENIPKNMNTVRGKEIRSHIMNKERESSFITSLIDLSIYFMKPRLHSCARDLISKLDGSGKDLALFTNGALYRIMKEVSYLNLEKYFTIIISAQDIKSLKPSPLGLQLIMKALGAKKSSTLYIGDMVGDIEAAKYAGISSCAISNGFSSIESLRAAFPDYLFGSIEELDRELYGHAKAGQNGAKRLRKAYKYRQRKFYEYTK